MQIPFNCSWGWRWILQSQSAAINFIRRIIGNGKKTSLWSDPWLPCGRVAEVFDQRAIYNMGIHNGNWKFSNAATHILREMFHIIQTHVLPNPEFEDEIVWTASDHVNFTLKSAMEVQNNQRRIYFK